MKRSRAKRTRKGSVKASARRIHGIGRTGKFPVFDATSARNALRLRGRGKGVSRSKVIAHVESWARAHHNKSVLARAKAARKADRSH